MSISIKIVTPEAIAFEGKGSLVTGPGFLGEFGVLKDHARFLTLNQAGLITLEQPGKNIQLVVGKGFAEVSDNMVTYLVDACHKKEDIEGDINEFIFKLNS